MAVLKRDEPMHVAELNVHDVHTILGPESTFEGKLVFDGTVRIDGHFKGEIHTDNILVIGQSARVEARICVGSVVINGEVEGDITAQHSVEVHAPGKVRGNVTTPELMVAKGTLFEGSSRMEAAVQARTTTVAYGALDEGKVTPFDANRQQKNSD